MTRSLALLLAFAAASCGTPAALPPADEGAADPSPEVRDEPAPEPAQPVSVNTGPACTSETDCAGRTPQGGATWVCARLPDDGVDGVVARECRLLFADTSELYCNVIDDCPPGRIMPAYSENVTCVEHHCRYTGTVSHGGTAPP